jgi:hypothetical protein
VSEGYVVPDDEEEAREKVQKLSDAVEALGDTLVAFFDAEVELPPLVYKSLTTQGHRALVNN